MTNKPLDDLTRPIEENVFRAREAFARLMDLRDTLYKQGCSVHMDSGGRKVVSVLTSLPQTAEGKLHVELTKVY